MPCSAKINIKNIFEQAKINIVAGLILFLKDC